MKIAYCVNHGKPRWRVNVQHGPYRKRLFFESREEATAFAEATRGPIKYKTESPRYSPPPPAPRPALAWRDETVHLEPPAPQPRPKPAPPPRREKKTSVGWFKDESE
jgi:hypothetical protein